MRYREIQPSPFARDFIDRYWVLEQDRADVGSVQRVVPDGSVELILNLAEPLESSSGGAWKKQPPSFLAGQITRPLRLRCAAPARVLGVRFLPHGPSDLLGMPMDEITDSFVPVADLSPALTSDLNRAIEAPTVAGQFASVEAALVRRARAKGNDPLVMEAVRQMRSGLGDMGWLASHLALSRRQFERRFSKRVGLPPKLFFRMQRFQRVFRAIEAETSNWADIAIRCGYYDQAHLIRDFKEFSGEAPRAVLEGDELAWHFLLHKAPSYFSKTADPNPL